MSGTCEVPKPIYPKKKVEPVEKKDGINSDLYSKEDIEKMIDYINKNPLITHTTSFRLNTDSDPWVIEVLDKDGNIIVKVPKEVVKMFYDDLSDASHMYMKGTLFDIDI